MLVALVDTLMLIFGPGAARTGATQTSPDTTATLCFSLLISAVLYSLSGYLATSLSGRRFAALLAGGLSGGVGGLIGSLAAILITTTAETLAQIVELTSFNILFNLLLGIMFGQFGSAFGARR